METRAGEDPEAHGLATLPPTFEAFYESTWERIARALAVTLGDVDLAGESVDEAMARAFQRWDRIARYDNPAGWVYRVGLNWGRSHQRRAVRRADRSGLEHHPVIDPVPVAEPAIDAALRGLPLDQRAVVVCRLLLDWSVEDTAAALRTSPGTVKSRLHRALKVLSTSLSDLR